MIRLEALPPREAIEYFRQKGYAIGFNWQDVWQQEHQAAFTVAKAMQLDILRDIRTAVDGALANGTTFADFRRDLKPQLVRKGWWGKAQMADPATGEIKEVQLGSTRRLKTIYDTNLRTAHSEGQWERIQESKASFPYLQYSGKNSEHPRIEHSAWDGMVLPVDDPWWQSHMPVKALGCKCRVIQMTGGMLERRGLSVSQAPVTPTYTHVNKRTGEVQQVPKGVDPTFNYPTGGRRANLPKLITDKIIQAPASVGASWWQTMLPLMAPAIADNFRLFAADALTTRQSQGKFAVAGFAHPVDVEFLREIGKAPISAEIAIQDRLIVGRKAARHEAAGDALTPEEWAALPEGLANPKAVLYDTETGNLLYVFDSIGDPRKQKLVVRPDFVIKKPKAQLNLARSTFKLKSSDLTAGVKGGRYRVVRGEIE